MRRTQGLVRYDSGGPRRRSFLRRPLPWIGVSATALVAALVVVLVRQADDGGTPASGEAGTGGARVGAAGPSIAPSGARAGAPGGTASATAPASAPPAVAACRQRDLWLCQDFDETAPGGVPSGWRAAGSVEVSTDQAHSGRNSLRAATVERGPRTITASLAPLGPRAGEQWGRIFYRVKTPAPASVRQILHSTIVAESAVSPLHGDRIEVRPVGIEGSHDGRQNFQYLYNVQPSGGRKEFATLSPFDFSYDSSWHCAEWNLSFANQRYRFFVDGREVSSIGLHNGPRKFGGTEIPPGYSSVTIGWTNYRSAAVDGFRGYEAWVDDFAMDGARVGCS
jgi:hypothetical protein